ncbi:hypothetical protein ACHJH3_08660 [Campylobacter sp. MOP7]
MLKKYINFRGATVEENANCFAFVRVVSRRVCLWTRAAKSALRKKLE